MLPFKVQQLKLQSNDYFMGYEVFNSTQSNYWTELLDGTVGRKFFSISKDGLKSIFIHHQALNHIINQNLRSSRIENKIKIFICMQPIQQYLSVKTSIFHVKNGMNLKKKAFFFIHLQNFSLQQLQMFFYTKVGAAQQNNATFQWIHALVQS